MKKFLSVLTLIVLMCCFTACKEEKVPEQEEVPELTPIEKFDKNLDDPNKGYRIEMDIGVAGRHSYVPCKAKGNIMYIGEYTLSNQIIPKVYIEFTENGYYTYEKVNKKWIYTYEEGELDVFSNPTDFNIEEFELVDNVYTMKEEKLEENEYKLFTIEINDEFNGGTITIIMTIANILITITTEIIEDDNVYITLPINRNNE